MSQAPRQDEKQHNRRKRGEKQVPSGGSHDQRHGSAPLPRPPRPKVAGKTVGSKKKKSDPPPFWQAEIVPLLSRLSLPPSDPLEVRETAAKLHKKLRERECYGRSGGVAGVKQRSAVLRSIFSLLDSSDPRLLLKLAHIIISVRPYTYTVEPL